MLPQLLLGKDILACHSEYMERVSLFKALLERAQLLECSPLASRPEVVGLLGAGFVVLAFGPFISLHGSGRDMEKEACSVSWSFH